MLLKLNNPSQLSQRFLQFWSQRTGKGYASTNYNGLIMQVQNDYFAKGLEFQEKEIPAQVDDFICTQVMSPQERGGNCSERMEGLGDWIKSAIAPVIHYSDQHFGTKLADCGGCAKRRSQLNKAVPFS